MNNYMEKVTEIAETLGWSVSIDDDSADFQYYTSYGQDCHMNITLTENYDTFIATIYSYYENYDVSEETSLWIDSTGHSKNGAPYEIEDIINDMKEFESAIYDLWKNLNADELNENSGYMDKEEFMAYLSENYSISGEAYRLIGNILDFVSEHYAAEDEQYNALCKLLDGTIGLSDNEIKKIIL